MRTSEQTQSYLTFKLGGETFAAGIDKVLEILEVPRITKVPRSPAYMRGVINLRGSVLPVFDTRSKFGFATIDDSKDTCIIVMELSSGDKALSIGAVVDAVQEVIEITPDDVQPAPSVGSKYNTSFIPGMVKRNDHFIMMLDLDLVFTTEELQLLNEIEKAQPVL